MKYYVTPKNIKRLGKTLRNKWRRNCILTFFLSINRLEIEYNYDILLLILKWLNVEDIVNPSIKEINENESLIKFCTSPWVISQLNRFLIIRRLDLIVHMKLGDIIFNDIEFVTFLLKLRKYEYINDINPEIFKKKENVMKLIPVFHKYGINDYVKDDFKFDQDVVLRSVKSGRYSEKYMRGVFARYKNDKEFVSKLITLDPSQYFRLKKEFKEDKEIVLKALKWEKNMIHFPKVILNDFKFVKEILKKNYRCAKYTPVGFYPLAY